MDDGGPLTDWRDAAELNASSPFGGSPAGCGHDVDQDEQHGQDEGRRGKKRKLPNASRACNGCRKRKTRCDGGSPSCMNCLSRQEECQYTAEHDARRYASRTFVAALQDRIRHLEAQLGELRQEDTTALCSTIPSELRRERELEGGQERERRESFMSDLVEAGRDDVEQVEGRILEKYQSATNRLKIDDITGELRHYGPTSAFMHLPNKIVETPASISSTPKQSVPTRSSPRDHRSLQPGPSELASSRDTGSMDRNRPHSFDWERNLPEGTGLTEVSHMQMLGLFFLYFNPWCHWTDREKFFHDMSSCLAYNSSSTSGPCLTRTAHYSPLLHNAILSLAACLSDEPSSRQAPHQDTDNTSTSPDLAGMFASKAKADVEVECEQPMLSTVQGLMLLSSYHSGSGRDAIGWLYSGMGIRVAQALGLNVDCSRFVKRSLISEDTKNDRDHTFYVCYVQDNLWSSYVGRTGSLTWDESEINLPAIEDRLDEQPSFVELGQWYGHQITPSLISTTFHWTCKLATIAEKIMSDIYALKADLSAPEVRSKLSQLHMRLEEWHNDLPETIAVRAEAPIPHILTLHSAYWFFYILLNRPFYSQIHHEDANGHNLHKVAVKRCIKAASKIVHLLNIFRKSPGLRYAPISMTQVAFTAGTIHLLTAVQNGPQAPRRVSQSVAAVEACIDALNRMGTSWKCAKQNETILAGLYNEYYSPAADLTQTESTHRLSKLPFPANSGPKAAISPGMLAPDSAFAKYLVEMGWKPPTEHSAPVAPAPPIGPVPSATELYHTPNVSTATQPSTSTYPYETYIFPYPRNINALASQSPLGMFDPSASVQHMRGLDNNWNQMYADLLPAGAPSQGTSV